MKPVEYDAEADALYVSVSSKPALVTLEISPRIGVDISRGGGVAGVEILDASKVLSDLFGSRVSKESLKRVLCRVSRDDAVVLDFSIGAKRARLALPQSYESPVLALPG